MRLEQAKLFNAASSFNYFEIQKYYQNEPKFNGIYSGYDLARLKNVTYIINLHEFKSIGTH